MEFPNAYAGVKKIFTAEILSLIAAFSGILTVVFTYFLSKTVVDEEVVSDGAAAVSLGGAAIFALATAVLGIIAFILTIIGSKKASADEPGFKIVFNLILVGIAVSVASGILSSALKDNTVNNIVSIVSDAIDLAVTIYIIQAIRNLAVKLGDAEMDKKGNNIYKLIVLVYSIVVIARLITTFTGSKAGTIVAGIFGITAGVLEIVKYVLYLIYLNKAKKMLA